MAHSTIRNYHNQLALFCSFVTDPRYGWVEQCESRFGAHPAQVCTEWNVASHRAGYEGRPEVRALSRTELQTFFDYADDQVVAEAPGRVRRLDLLRRWSHDTSEPALPAGAA